MHQNPYLAQYFSASPDTSVENDAPPFVRSGHMRQRVFRPSARSGAFTPPSTPAAGRPPLSPASSRHSTPVETNGQQHPNFPLLVNGMPENLQKLVVSPRGGKVEGGGVPNWESMIRHSHDVIAQAKELLNIENFSEVNDVGSSAKQVVYMASQTESKKEKEVIPDGVISDSLAHTEIVKKAEEVSKEPNSVVLQEEEEKMEVNKGIVVSNSKTVCVESKPSVCNNYDRKITQIPVESTIPEAKCLVVTLNPNSAECLAKRLTRRPSYAFAFQKNHNSIVSDLNEHPRIPCVVVEEKLVSKSRSKEQKLGSSSKEKKKKEEGVISVASLYGILERLADVVHPRSVDPVGSNSKKTSLDTSHERRRNPNDSIEDHRERGGLQKRDNTRRFVPTPQVIVGSAPHINNNEPVVGNDVNIPSGVLPTSQLAKCGVSPHRIVPQRAPSARRTSFNRTSGTPGYALPTESWLCKGAEISDVQVDTSSIPNGMIPKGPLH
ncbi:hypothetical protein LSM04_002984 [Trypanosoma melophagium]|uniref:uncharacterized protein n=1 Tax=Trypanosoma melophagium TaxID=715481 RepID=UPI00351A29D9|nr:hypothetical protein LSM04_002984 [Trypanosoma melophagium]